MIALTLLVLVLASVPVFPTQEFKGAESINPAPRILFSLSRYKECFVAPEICPNSNITFYLYTRDTKDSPQRLNPSDPDSLKNAKFLQGRPVKFLLHGYLGDRDEPPNKQLRPIYLNYSNVNVISVDYGPLVRDPCYVWATYNVPIVANCTAQLIDKLVEYHKVDLSAIHIVGFSLGGQVAGQIANFIKSGKLDRITGLDPALPLFVGVHNNQKLDASDALFVDVIHTNAGFRGKVEASGNVDFYVNGGSRQPGCQEFDANNASSCAHVRAPILFAESIYTKNGFYGYPCSRYLTYFTGLCPGWDGASHLELMGENVNRSARGVYFLNTNEKPPYAQGRTKNALSTQSSAPLPVALTSNRQPRYTNQ